MNYIEHSVFINKSNCSFIRLFSANSYTYSVPGTWSSHCASLSSIKPWKSHPDIDIRIKWGKIGKLAQKSQTSLTEIIIFRSCWRKNCLWRCGFFPLAKIWSHDGKRKAFMKKSCMKEIYCSSHSVGLYGTGSSKILCSISVIFNTK